jgi:hypothetical protein
MTRKECATIIVVGVAAWLVAASQTAQSHTIETDCGRNVTHTHCTWPDWNTTDKQGIKDAIENDFTDVQIQGEATKYYTCHPYVWAESTNTYSLTNGSVYMDSHKVDWMDGHHLTYEHCFTNSPTHSAKDHVPLTYRATSKWGTFCLVEHDWDEVPDGSACSWSGQANYSDYGEDAVGIYDDAPCCGAVPDPFYDDCSS